MKARQRKCCKSEKSGKSNEVRTALNFGYRSKRNPVRHGLSTIKMRLKMSSEYDVLYASGMHRIFSFMHPELDRLTYLFL